METPTTINISLPLDVPAQLLWGLFRDFANWASWNPVYISETIIGQVKEGAGLIRHNETLMGIIYEDVLKVLDDSKMYLEYNLLSIEPKKPFISGIVTSISIKALDQKHSQITWQSNISFVPGTEKEKTEPVVKALKSFYKKTIKSAYINLALNKIHHESFGILNKRLLEITQALLVGQNPVWQYAEYHVKPLPKMVKGLPAKEALPPMKVGQMLGRLLEANYIQANNAILHSNDDEDEHADDEDFLRDIASYITPGLQTVEAYGKPSDKIMTEYLSTHWESDVEFCQQYLQGANPLQIQAVKSLDEIPFNMLHLKAQGKDLKELIHEKRLFIADYADLDGIPLKQPMYFYAPTILFFNEHLPCGEKRLNIVGIRLERTDTAPIYTPDMPQKNRFKLAKMFVACADNQIHQFALHLGISHLAMEPIIVAVHNKLPEKHPLHILLKPHLQETIGINFLARQTLIASTGAATDDTFALGTAEGIKLASKFYKDYDFYKFSFPQHLKARGFDREGTDGLTNYLFRDDGFRLWDLLETYITNYVNEHYKSDDDQVKNDKDLQEWAKEMAAPEKAAVPGFKSEFKTRREVVEALQIIIWNGSALHSFLNFPQWPYVGNIPNRPNALYTPMPEDKGHDLTPKDIKKALASAFPKAFQLSVPWALSLPSNTSLMDLGEQEKTNGDVGKKFHQSLLDLTAFINQRNKVLIEQGKAPYPYLLPENVACSVDI